MKTCSKCKGKKPATTENFIVTNPITGRLCSWCRPCMAGNTARWYQRNHAEAKVAMRATYRDDPAPYKERTRRWRETNPERKVELDRAWATANPEKVAASKKKWRQENMEQYQAAQRRCYLKRQYGITPEDYERLYREQGGVCAICKGVPKPGERFHVDHDHETGARRSLLCRKCNTALGMFLDSPELLREAAVYLERHRKAQEERIRKSNLIAFPGAQKPDLV